MLLALTASQDRKLQDKDKAFRTSSGYHKTHTSLSPTRLQSDAAPSGSKSGQICLGLTNGVKGINLKLFYTLLCFPSILGPSMPASHSLSGWKVKHAICGFTLFVYL